MTENLLTRTSQYWVLLVPIAAMSLVILVSNELVNHPINDWLTWGAFSYPISFLVTDMTNRLFKARAARRVVYVGFALGVALSVLVDVRIAIASGSAFLIAQLLDIYVFNILRNLSWWKAPLTSSVVGSAIDTALFFTIAFAYTDLPWATWAVGDFGAKLLMAWLLLPVFRILVRYYPKSIGGVNA
jgi:uncharacterized PurR-regulated membrane protein YhhQ (DUF165 family)